MNNLKQNSNFILKKYKKYRFLLIDPMFHFITHNALRAADLNFRTSKVLIPFQLQESPPPPPPQKKHLLLFIIIIVIKEILTQRISCPSQNTHRSFFGGGVMRPTGGSSLQ